MMGLDTLLSRLDKVKTLSNGRWQARCPAHEDQNPSLAIKECDDGTVLVHCFGGCGARSVLNAIGMSFEDLFPGNSGADRKGERRPFPATDILRVIGFEVLVVANCVFKFSYEGLTPADKERLLLAANRIQNAIHYSGISI